MVGETLGKYQILDEIGRGGMGVVYRGYDTALQRPVAVKVLAPHLVWEKDFVERFLREARTAAQLRHSNIVTVYDVGEQGGNYYIVMGFLEGETLSQMVARRGPLSVAEVASVVSQVASALDYAHGQGLVHRDIKPGNVIVDKEGHVTLTDFGIARAVEGTRLTSAGAILGTPEYMSPEQALGQEADRRSDIYSLGVVCYEMLTGRAPFHAETPLATLHQQAYEPPLEPRKLNPNLSLAVERVLLKALAKEPRGRYGVRPWAARPATVVERPLPRPWRSVMPWVGAGLGVIGLVVVILVFGRGPGPGSEAATATALARLQATPVAQTVIASPTATAALTPTPTRRLPTAKPTERPAPTATLTKPPTATPTVTRIPTATPAKVAAQAASCSFKPSDAFYRVWQAEQRRLGCALNEVKVFTAEQPFENGLMFWREDRDRFIHVLYNKGTWRSYEGTFKEGDPETAGYSPPPGLHEPRRGFGQVWRDELGGPNSEIGWAVYHELGFPDDRWVDCEHGMMLWSSQWGEQWGVFVLYDDGTWKTKK